MAPRLSFLGNSLASCENLLSQRPTVGDFHCRNKGLVDEIAHLFLPVRLEDLLHFMLGGGHQSSVTFMLMPSLRNQLSNGRLQILVQLVRVVELVGVQSDDTTSRSEG